MSRDLRPSMLDDLGILTTLTWFCRNFGKVYPDISIKKHLGLKETDVPEHLKIVIFRILQEAVNNVAKQVEIHLGRKGKAIEFKIQDNGQGFAQRTALSKDTTQKGFGLTSLKDRTELSGGTFKLKTAPREGAAILARWLVEVSRPTTHNAETVKLSQDQTSACTYYFNYHAVKIEDYPLCSFDIWQVLS